MQITASPHDLLATLFRAAADPIRVRILGLLGEAGELCVCEVETALEITQSRASRHLATLKRAGLLEDRRDGAWVYYRIARAQGPGGGIIRAIRNTLRDDGITAGDVARATALRDENRCSGERR